MKNKLSTVPRKETINAAHYAVVNLVGASILFAHAFLISVLLAKG